MTEIEKLSYHDIEVTPANKLLELPDKRLEAFITEADRIRNDAETTMNWLKSIKTMKAQIARAEQVKVGGTE
ncbi:MAG: hypothetical protein AAF065_13210 [Verrucomicrobiota bacterium]